MYTVFFYSLSDCIIKINSLLQTDNFARCEHVVGFVINFQFMEISAQKLARELQK